MKLAADSLNHLLRQNAWATDRLRVYAGKTVKLALTPLEACFTIAANGEVSPATADTVADAGIMLTPFAALRLLTRQEQDNSGLALEGDTELAAAVGKVLQQLQWEYEEDLSKLIGDIPAQELVSLGKRVAAEGQRQLLSLAGMFTEYWLEERPLIARQRDLARFSAEVDTLRDDAERLAKRVDKLEKSL